MPQKKYDLTSERGNIEKEFKTEADRQKRLDEIVNADYKQRTLPKKYKLPTFDCPACRAKNIMFAGDAVAKNETVLSLLEESGILVPRLVRTRSNARHISSVRSIWKKQFLKVCAESFGSHDAMKICL